VEGGELAQNTKKILNSGNEPKNVLKTRELSFSGAKNELLFEGKRTQIKAKNRAKNRRVDAARCCSVVLFPLAVPLQRDRPAVGQRKSPERDSSSANKNGGLRMTGLED
jgi:hypothetical protein